MATSALEGLTTTVKGRVVESGLAGALLLETKGAPTSYWFRPGLDYLEYETPEEAADIIRRLSHEPEKTQSIAQSLRSRVLAEHTGTKPGTVRFCSVPSMIRVLACFDPQWPNLNFAVA